MQPRPAFWGSHISSDMMQLANVLLRVWKKHVKHKVTRFSEIAMIMSMDAAADLTCGLDDINIIMRRASVE